MNRGVVGVIAAALAAWTAPAWAQLSNDSVKVGVATDLSSLYADINGPGAVLATEMAIADFGGTVLGKKIELVSGDIQNKADVAASLASRWYDNEKVDMILGAGASSSSIAIQGVAGDKKKIFLAPDPASSDLTGKLCNPYTVHWVYDTVGARQRHRLGGREVGRQELVLPHRRLRLRLRPAARRRRRRHQGRRQGGGRGPAPDQHQDFSSFLLQAQASKAQIIGLANAGGDTINSIKQAAEFGIVKGGQKLAGLLVFVTDVHSLGLERAQGLQPHRGLLLGPQRQDPRLLQALRREVQGQDADLGAGRLLFGRRSPT